MRTEWKKPSLYDEYAEALEVPPERVIALVETPDKHAFVLYAVHEQILAIVL